MNHPSLYICICSLQPLPSLILYIQARKHLTDALKARSIAIFHSNINTVSMRTQVFSIQTKQRLIKINRHLSENTVLVLFPIIPFKRKARRYLYRKNQTMKTWDGDTLSVSDIPRHLSKCCGLCTI